MKTMILAVCLPAFAASAAAAGPTCSAQAGDKKLAGAAMDSYLEKCVATAVSQ